MDIILKRKQEEKIKDILSEMPSFVEDFMKSIIYSPTTTKLNYLYDIRLFLLYISESYFNNKSIKEFTYDDLNKITMDHINNFFEYISYYESNITENNGEEKIIVRKNTKYGLERKGSTLRSLYSKLYNITLSKDENEPNTLKRNLAPLIKLPKKYVPKKHVLDKDEIGDYIQTVIKGEGSEGAFTEPQKRYIENNILNRDLAIVYTLIETGVRVSELSNIDIDDINFKDNTIKVTRKGGKEEFVYFNVAGDFLFKYYQERKEITPLKGYEKAFFLSLQRKRITSRSIQILVKKYGNLFTNKTITPHTFRRTLATNIYRETGDVYLIASMIGDTVAVAEAHYTHQNEDAKRNAIKNYLTPKKD